MSDTINDLEWDEIQAFVDEYSWEKLKEVYDYLQENDEMNYTHRLAADDLDLPPAAFERIFQQLKTNK